MQFYENEFMRYMDANGVKYSRQKDNVVKVTYSGDNMDSIPIYVFFDEDNEPYVSFKCWDILNFKSNEGAALIVCNNLNNEYRWVKFFVDSDKDVVVSLDAMVDRRTCGEECLSLVRRMVNILDEAYPQIAKARWA